MAVISVRSKESFVFKAFEGHSKVIGHTVKRVTRMNNFVTLACVVISGNKYIQPSHARMAVA